MTGWLEVDDDGQARYSPHTSKGFTAPPAKTLLLVTNGLLAKRGLRQARKHGVAEGLAAAARDSEAARSAEAVMGAADAATSATADGPVPAPTGSAPAGARC